VTEEGVRISIVLPHHHLPIEIDWTVLPGEALFPYLPQK
jgi:hypothetical protein